MTVKHPFPAVCDSSSEVLVLGSFPSVKSREQNFYYCHPQNRFWRVLASVFGEDVPVTVEEKTRILLDHGIALWDSIAECEITGSSDASIKNVITNDIKGLLDRTGIKAVFCNGSTSFKVYEKYIFPVTGLHAGKLPSTSPANAAWSTDRLTDAWSIIAHR